MVGLACAEDVLGAQAQDGGRRRRPGIKGRLRGGQRAGNRAGLDGQPKTRAVKAGRDQVHRRRGKELRHEGIGGIGIDLKRRADLFDMAVPHDADAVAHGHRLDMVMGDEDHRLAQPAVQLHQLLPHLAAQLGIKIGQRLVHQEDVRLAHHGAAQRDPLALPARQRAGSPVKIGTKAKDRRRLGDALVLLGDRGAAHLHAKAHVLAHRHMRVKRVALEHHRDIAVAWRQIGHVARPDPDPARADLLKPRDHPQRGRLAAARRPQKHHELPFRDGQGNVLDPENAGAEIAADRV
ncbi:hypothetical protein MASR1M32_20270 [Rhodobacter sp.]